MNALLNLIHYQEKYDIIDKIVLHVKDTYEPKYKYLIESISSLV